MSKHRHHKRSHFGQHVLAFFLFIMISVLSLSLCAKTYIANPNTFATMFTDEKYVSSMRDDVITFAKDECKKCSIPDGFLEKSISYDLIYSIESSYINDALGTSNAFSNEAFEDNIATLNENIKKDMEKEFAVQGVKISDKEKIQQFADSITNYASQKAQFKYIDKLQAILNISKPVIGAVIVISLVLAIFLSVFIFLGRSKQYRAMRNICYSFEAAALFDFVMVLAVAIVRSTKDLVVYPSYLCSAFMDYVNKSMLSVTVAGAVLAIISIIITVVIWRIKFGNKHK